MIVEDISLLNLSLFNLLRCLGIALGILITAATFAIMSEMHICFRLFPSADLGGSTDVDTTPYSSGRTDRGSSVTLPPGLSDSE